MMKHTSNKFQNTAAKFSFDTKDKSQRINKKVETAFPLLFSLFGMVK